MYDIKVIIIIIIIIIIINSFYVVIQRWDTGNVNKTNYK